MNNNNLDLVSSIEKIILRLGYECVNVAFKSDFGSSRVRLQILIDSIGGINVDDCERVSKNINAFLDKHDESFAQLQKNSYYLEVSSPGLERPLFKLDDYVRFVEREAKIRLSELIDGRKNFTGKLSGVRENNILILINENGEEILKTIPFELIKSANLVFRFESESKSEKNHSGKSRKNHAKRNS